MFHLTFCAQLGTKADWEKEHGGGENAQEKRGGETAGDRERKARIEREREREREGISEESERRPLVTKINSSLTQRADRSEPRLIGTLYL